MTGCFQRAAFVLSVAAVWVVLATRSPAQDAAFVRGDANANGVIDIADGVFILNFLFTDETVPSCLDAADADDLGANTVNITDAIFLLNFLFLDGAAPPAPGSGKARYDASDCGPDPTADSLGCGAFPPCPGIPTGVTSLRTLSGKVRDPAGAGIPGVAVFIDPAAVTFTDDQGMFVLQEPPSGTVHVHFDGSTASAPGSRFAELGVAVDIAASGPTVLWPAVTLPDMNASSTVMGDAVLDEKGRATEPIDVMAGDGSLGLQGAKGTMVFRGGVPAAERVELTITHVDFEDVPMPLPPDGDGQGALDPSSFVSIQPADASFDTGGGLGLDVVLPNLRGFRREQVEKKVVTIEIWSFDHDAGRWMNRSAQTGSLGEVIELPDGETAICARGAITKGGWHAPVIRVDPACATTLTGRVVGAGGTPIPDTHVGVSTGNLGRTGADGRFTIPSVPAYVAADLPGACTPAGVRLDLVTPLAFGSVAAEREVGAEQVVPGGITDVGDIAVPAGETGAVAGRVIDNGAGVSGIVAIRGPTNVDVLAGESGAFFVAGLEPGPYTATFQFRGAPAPTSVAFAVRAGEIETITIQRLAGAGTRNITTLVVLVGPYDNVSTAAVPASGAFVVLVGTDPGSSGGIIARTNAEGEARFTAVDGPFTVTAQRETARIRFPGSPPIRQRLATTVAGIDPPSGTIGIPTFADDRPLPAVLDAQMTGTIQNLALQAGEGISGRVVDSFGFLGCVVVAPDGSYSAFVPSGMPFDLFLVHSEGDAGCGFAGNPLHVLIARGLGPVAAGEAIVLDFDFKTQAVPFNRDVAVVYENVPPGLERSEIGLVFGERDSNVAFTLAVGGAELPTKVSLPDPGHEALGGMDIFLEVEMETIDELREAWCSRKVEDVEQPITVTFPGEPTLTRPLAPPALEEAPAMRIEFTEGAGGLPKGANLVHLDTEYEEEGREFDNEWTIILRPGTTSVELPPVALEMFGVSRMRGKTGEKETLPGRLELSVAHFRTSFALEFDSFFSEDIAADFRAMERSEVQCEVETEAHFDILPAAGE